MQNEMQNSSEKFRIFSGVMSFSTKVQVPSRAPSKDGYSDTIGIGITVLDFAQNRRK